jgi:hypothetical protein
MNLDSSVADWLMREVRALMPLSVCFWLCTLDKTSSLREVSEERE